MIFGIHVIQIFTRQWWYTYNEHTWTLVPISINIYFIIEILDDYNIVWKFVNAAVAQWIRAFDLQAEHWVYESQPRQSEVVKTGSDSSAA